MFNKEIFNRRFSSSKKNVKIAGVIISIVVVIGVIIFFWLGAVIVGAIQEQGLKGIFDSIWNGSK